MFIFMNAPPFIFMNAPFIFMNTKKHNAVRLGGDGREHSAVRVMLYLQQPDFMKFQNAV